MTAPHDEPQDDLPHFRPRSDPGTTRYATPAADVPADPPLTAEIPTRLKPDSSPEPILPRRFGRYELLRELGHGGMGTVYEARQDEPQRLVALKVIRAAELATEDDVRRFRHEANEAARLDHPHIVPVYEVGQHQGRHYFTMKLIEGGSLAQHLDRYKDDPKGAARLLALVARAVHFAHQRQLLHRDLKPGNVLLDEQGRPYVADFGLAKRLGGSGEASNTAVVGTPEYMAPEQVRSARLTTAADVYALGGILYTLLAGRAPFVTDSSWGTLQKVLSEEPARPSLARPGVPHDLETICLKCLAKEPGRRYGSAEALAEDLERWLNGEPITARRTGRVERVRLWCRRNPAVAALLTAVVVLILLAVAGIGWKYREAEFEKGVAQQQTEIAEGQRREAEAATEQAREKTAAEERAKEEVRTAKAAVEQALRESERRLALSYFAYGRLCAVAARLAAGEDPKAAGEARREFQNLRKAIAQLGDDAVKGALDEFAELVEKRHDEAPADEDLKRSALRLAKACRTPWTALIDAECPELANQVRRLLYERVTAAADELAGAARWEDAARARQEFWELYWGELVIVEGPEVERSMVKLGDAVKRWQPGTRPSVELKRLAAELRQVCRLPGNQRR
jgi:hypothetical protein